jgi:hypothetical protein
MRFLISCGETRTLLRRKEGDKTVAPVIVTGMEEPLPTTMDEGSKPATGEGMDKSTLVHTQIQIIIIHFLPSPFSLIANG